MACGKCSAAAAAIAAVIANLVIMRLAAAAADGQQEINCGPQIRPGAAALLLRPLFLSLT